MSLPRLPDPRSAGPLARPGTGKRIGTAERDRVADALAEHYAAGRLSHEELETRTQAALQAQTTGDLHVLVRDLPLLPARRSGPGMGKLVLEGAAGVAAGLLAALMGLIALVMFLAGDLGGSGRSLLVAAVFALMSAISFWLLNRDRRRRR